jgi:hypothetical protein
VLRFLCARFLLSVGGEARKSSGCQSYRTQAEKASPRGVFHHGSFFRMIGHHLYLSLFRGWISRSMTETIRRSRRVSVVSHANAPPNPPSPKMAVRRALPGKPRIDRAEPCRYVDAMSGDGHLFWIAAGTALVEASKTTADLTTSLQKAARNRPSFRKTESIFFLRFRPIEPVCRSVTFCRGHRFRQSQVSHNSRKQGCGSPDCFVARSEAECDNGGGGEGFAQCFLARVSDNDVFMTSFCLKNLDHRVPRTRKINHRVPCRILHSLTPAFSRLEQKQLAGQKRHRRHASMLGGDATRWDRLYRDVAFYHLDRVILELRPFTCRR